MANQAGTPGSGFFYRQPASGSNAGVPPTPPDGNGRRFTGKQLLLAFLGGSFAIGYLTMGNSSTPLTRFAHPVRVMGTGVSVRSEPLADASVLASVSNTDSVENLGRLNDQWSRVRMRDGRTGFISNQYLEGVSYVPLAAGALAATALARPYPTTPYTTRRSGRFLRSRLGSRRSRSVPSYTTPAPAAAPSKALTYTTTYSTARRSSAPSYRSSSSYPRTYAAPRVNYTFSSGGRSGRRRR